MASRQQIETLLKDKATTAAERKRLRTARSALDKGAQLAQAAYSSIAPKVSARKAKKAK